MIQIFITLIIFLISIMLTGLIRGFALRKNILDVPNVRSSHHVPTPRGGGISFVFLFNILALWMMLHHKIPISLFYALLGGIVIAGVGWLDDILSVSSMWRAMIHIMIATFAVYCIGGLSNFNVMFSYPFAVICIVWCINLYNFMDGIDGLAGVEGLFISLCVALMLGNSGVGLLCFLFAGAIGGFLVWNWPPAKIFMGDVGSSYLGYIFSVLAIATANLNMLPLTFWIIISAIFLCDTTFTVLYRIYNGERWYEAHRKHAYQRLVQCGISHKIVTMSIYLVNIFILFPIAFTMFYYPSLSFKIVSILLVGFFVLWIFIMSQDYMDTTN
ncbi:MAG TPA: glycosyltransferase family 4 protein [Gammaproteobacteria bacterium]|nr:glycosyltransferase family 4 protein [Gammaproteobacteria bacterium]